MANDVSESRSILVAIALLVLIAGLITGDVWVDYAAGTTAAHVVLELSVLVLAVIGVVVLWRRFQEARRTVIVLQRDIAVARREAEQWREEAGTTLRDFKTAIERQFDRWSLSTAERDIAMCLLGGLSHKEVAVRRNTSERTVREQARSVYQKSGVAGRSELAAFFLGDLSTA